MNIVVRIFRAPAFTSSVRLDQEPSAVRSHSWYGDTDGTQCLSQSSHQQRTSPQGQRPFSPAPGTAPSQKRFPIVTGSRGGSEPSLNYWHRILKCEQLSFPILTSLCMQPPPRLSFRILPGRLSVPETCSRVSPQGCVTGMREHRAPSLAHKAYSGNEMNFGAIGSEAQDPSPGLV